MLTLYHNAVSTCSQKVGLVLAHKKLKFTSREIDLIGGAQHDPEYVKLSPNHVVPTLVHDDHVLIESTLINEYLDEAFPDTAMRPIRPCGTGYECGASCSTAHERPAPVRCAYRDRIRAHSPYCYRAHARS
ncbi:MAG: glutathione S-transferase family protein [Pseudomonadales bacterium]|mgnify:CR=1 FL=1|jgi:glutathione S-transferase|nr:glutathione S-transferase family protein [Pseudomonadales bacterium]MDP6469749.1 glutathione S-transferase family protein [Pseudomonadales bacterium]MDP6827649.1 glutathione S-transferase family protein [Pseudomonadales bacterium]MDP6971910.1 glutathione S-transferase family protein [Pseudomonadales bacterium]|tara:strand:+ start:703 stop:1095 length:393 start_codon:yes stop_codon:yes gene_type:complete